MIDTIANLLFRCSHRRLTRPITLLSKPGVPHGDAYVVCLDCGQQFAYDWAAMRIGKRIKTSAATGVLPPDLPKPRSAMLKWGLFVSALPLFVLMRSVIKSKPPK